MLSKVKLIAEPWDCGGYQVGSFPNWDIWAEWNGIYRDVVRRFVRGDPGLKAELATRIAGSADLYHTNNRCAARLETCLISTLRCALYPWTVKHFLKDCMTGQRSREYTSVSARLQAALVHCRKASHSVNFVVAHDGFTLADLVAYNNKHNEANGEDGKDGTNDNFSWNCGAEGATQEGGVQELRWRQMRNFMLMLLMSRGTPMVVAGAALV